MLNHRRTAYVATTLTQYDLQDALLLQLELNVATDGLFDDLIVQH